MKTMPKVGDKIFWYTLGGEKRIEIIEAIDGPFVIVGQGFSSFRIHFKAIGGRTIKKKRVCEECAKTKRLYYLGHHDLQNSPHSDLDGYILRADKKATKNWSCTSTLALISTEENKK